MNYPKDCTIICHLEISLYLICIVNSFEKWFIESELWQKVGDFAKITFSLFGVNSKRNQSYKIKNRLILIELDELIES